MVDRLLGIQSRGADAADALAIAIAALNHSGLAGGAGADQPDRGQPGRGLAAAIEAALAREEQGGRR